METLIKTKRVALLQDKMMAEPRYVSIEQALIITKTYEENQEKPVIIKRALALKNALLQLSIAVEPEEKIVGNRTIGVRQGVVFPESGSSWIEREFETLPTRPQDKFNVREEDIINFKKIISSYFKDKSLEDVIRTRYGKEIDEIAKVVKMNQKDHAQGHICPDCEKWLIYGPEGLKQEAIAKLQSGTKDQQDFYKSVILVMEGTQAFMMRYHDLLVEKAGQEIQRNR